MSYPELTPANGALPDLIEDEDASARVLDLTLAERLGFTEARMIRKLIKRHREALEGIGSLFHRVTNPGSKGGRRATAFYLTEAQALFILAKSDTARANIELAYVAEVFTEFRRGNLTARDADTQARLEVYQTEREVRLARHLEDRQARSEAFKLIGQGRKRRRASAPPR